MILLDTHVLIWFAENHPRLGRQATRLTDRALRRDEAAVCAISFWEIAMLVTRGRLRVDLSPPALRQKVLEQGIRELPVTGAIAVSATGLPGLRGDPADRMIVATALAEDGTLITADDGILDWKGGLRARDARR